MQSVRYDKRTRCIAIRISQREEEFLKAEALKQGKSVSELVREGYIGRFGYFVSTIK